MFFDEEIDRHFRHLFHSLRGSGPALEEFGKADVIGPFYYGYTMTVGPDGRPVVKEYGNAGPGGQTRPGPQNLSVETIVDDEQKMVKLVAEMPGVEKSDLQIRVNGKTVSIDARNDKREYHSVVPLRARVDTDSVKASYKNGILEVAFKQAAPDKLPGKVVEVE